MTCTATMTTITPDMAIDWLESANNGNRRLRPWWAEALAAAIRRGEWITTHQGVAFTERGRLLDGQHRLKAIALANRPVDMFVFNGIPESAFSVIDIGVKRSVQDTTGLTKKTGEAARFLATLRFGGGTSPQQVMAVAQAGVEEIHERLMSYCSTTKAIFSSAPVRSAAVLLVMDGHSEAAVFKVYADTLNQRFEEMPSVAQGFVRQVIAGKLTANNGRLDLLARALKFLNPQNADLVKIQCTEADATAAAAYGRSLIARAMEEAA